MDELSPDPASPPLSQRVGESLRAAREAQGLSLAEVAARTRIPLRHLEGIEQDDYTALPSPTYATGFAKAYARAVGVDEVDAGRRVRGAVAGMGRRVSDYQPYEATDPARVPSRGVAVVALGLALAVLILAGLYFSTGLFRSKAAAPQATDNQPVAAMAPTTAPGPVVPAGGQVLVTASDEVWVRIYDRDGKTLHQGTLQPGEHFEVPADAADPMINVGRPDKLEITVNGSRLQGLDLGRDPIKDVHVSASALTARARGTREPEPAAIPTAAPGAAKRPRETSGDTRSTARRAARPALTETQRVNLDAAAASPPPGNTQ